MRASLGVAALGALAHEYRLDGADRLSHRELKRFHLHVSVMMQNKARQIALEGALVEDLGAIRLLLDSASLPHDDLTEELLRHFLVARVDSRIVGVVGLERCQEATLLRSLVVAKEQSGLGIGRQLVDAAEKMAANMNIKSIFLLTTTADGFFESLGFRRLRRDLAPPAIKKSHQFASLCPITAVLMVKP